MPNKQPCVRGSRVRRMFDEVLTLYPWQLFSSTIIRVTTFRDDRIPVHRYCPLSHREITLFLCMIIGEPSLSLIRMYQWPQCKQSIWKTSINTSKLWKRLLTKKKTLISFENGTICYGFSSTPKHYMQLIYELCLIRAHMVPVLLMPNHLLVRDH